MIQAVLEARQNLLLQLLQNQQRWITRPCTIIVNELKLLLVAINKLQPTSFRLFWLAVLLLPTIKAIQEAISYYSSATINSWAATELMINNSAGFVRRGLSGSILLWLHQFAPSPFLHEFGLLLALTTITASSFLILNSCRRLGLFDGLMIAYSPAIYPLFASYYIDTLFRKDGIIVLFVIAILLANRLKSRWKLSALILLAVIGMPILTLMHEMSPFFCLAPLLLTFFLQIQNSLKNTIIATIFSIALAAPTILALAIAKLHGHPSSEIVINMCNSWQTYYPELQCNPIDRRSAFSTLADYNLSQDTLDWVHSPQQVGRLITHGWLTVIYLLAMAFGPLGRLASLESLPQKTSGAWVALLLIGTAVVPTLPMYWLATDFGRWLALGLTIGTLMICNPSLVRAISVLADGLSLNASLFTPSGYRFDPSFFRAISANINGVILLFNLVAIPEACCSLIWMWSPLFRILFKPFGY